MLYRFLPSGLGTCAALYVACSRSDSLRRLHGLQHRRVKNLVAIWRAARRRQEPASTDVRIPG